MNYRTAYKILIVWCSLFFQDRHQDVRSLYRLLGHLPAASEMIEFLTLLPLPPSQEDGIVCLPCAFRHLWDCYTCVLHEHHFKACYIAKDMFDSLKPFIRNQNNCRHFRISQWIFFYVRRKQCIVKSSFCVDQKLYYFYLRVYCVFYLSSIDNKYKGLITTLWS